MDKIKSYWVDCSKCGKLLEVGSSKAVSAICSRCTHLGCIALMSEEQVNELFGKHKIAKPAGWHFMAEFVAEDGKVYHKGKEQPTLEGTLSPSKVKKNKKVKKKVKKNIIKDLDDLSESELNRLAKDYKRKRKVK